MDCLINLHSSRRRGSVASTEGEELTRTEKLKTKWAALDALKKSLLYQAFTGQL